MKGVTDVSTGSSRGGQQTPIHFRPETFSFQISNIASIALEALHAPIGVGARPVTVLVERVLVAAFSITVGVAPIITNNASSLSVRNESAFAVEWDVEFVGAFPGLDVESV